MGLKELKKRVGALVKEDEVYQTSDLAGVAYLFSLSRENYYKLFFSHCGIGIKCCVLDVVGAHVGVVV